MNWMTAFYVTNITSGLLLAALGWFAATRPRWRVSYSLPLFLLLFGTQYVLSNSAVAAQSPFTAHMLVYLTIIAGPLQALLLLSYVREENPGRLGTRIIARLAGFLVGLSMMVGFIVPLWDKGSLFTIVRMEDGGFTKDFGWAHTFFHVPQFIGVALAVLLLAYTATPTDKQGWRLRAGLAFVVAWSYAWSFATEVRDPSSGWLFTALTVAALLLVSAGSYLFASAQEAQLGRLPAIAVLTACAVPLFAEHLDELSLWYFGTPGLGRLLGAVVLLAPALLPTEEAAGLVQPRSWPHALVLLFVLTTGTVGILNHLDVAVSTPWRILGLSTGAAAILGVELLSVGPATKVLRTSAPADAAGATA